MLICVEPKFDKFIDNEKFVDNFRKNETQTLPSYLGVSLSLVRGVILLSYWKFNKVSGLLATKRKGSTEGPPRVETFLRGLKSS